MLSAAQTGAGWAFRVLYDDLAPAVHGYLRTRGAAEPEDLTSEVLLAVFTRLHSFVGGRRELRSWVFTIAHHRLVDDLRQRSRRPPALPLEVGDDERHAPSAEEEAITALGRERVQALIDALVPEQAAVIALRFVGDLTIEQIAEVLGKSPGAVKQLQRRALAALARILAREGVTL